MARPAQRAAASEEGVEDLDTITSACFDDTAEPLSIKIALNHASDCKKLVAVGLIDSTDASINVPSVTDTGDIQTIRTTLQHLYKAYGLARYDLDPSSEEGKDALQIATAKINMKIFGCPDKGAKVLLPYDVPLLFFTKVVKLNLVLSSNAPARVSGEVHPGQCMPVCAIEGATAVALLSSWNSYRDKAEPTLRLMFAVSRKCTCIACRDHSTNFGGNECTHTAPCSALPLLPAAFVGSLLTRNNLVRVCQHCSQNRCAKGGLVPRDQTQRRPWQD